ncbi:MAG: membrane dipeptidase, partial [Bacteroidota bacterium]|nr:membrane dipeptidase [Bacteroidota bacterium]
MIIDIHCHPALKSYLFENSLFSVNLQDEHKSVREVNYLRLQTDIPNMKRGGLRAAISAHYIPEVGLMHESTLIKMGSSSLSLFWRSLKEKLEMEDSGQSVFEQTLESIRIFELKIISAQMDSEVVTCAHSFEEFHKLLNEDKIVFLHSVEGAHSLGRSHIPEDHLRNLDILFDKGVCMLTLGHFYDNDLVSPTEGIPPLQRRLFDKHTHKDLTKGLSPIGEIVVRHMIEKGMLIDLVHSTPIARKRIFEINDEYKGNKRPLVFSHSGVQKLFVNEAYPSDKYYSPDTEEILKIKDCNGLIGIVFMNYWLTGKDDRFLKYEPAMDYVYQTIKVIHTVTNSFDNIAIGTDFDAMNNPSDDLFNHSFLPKLVEYLDMKGIS